MDARTIWTTAQIARVTGRNTDTVRRWIRGRRLPAERPAGGPLGWRVRRDDLDRFCLVWLAAPLADLEERASGQSRPTP